MGSQSNQEVVVAAVRQWQTRLLQLDRRNALLYFPAGKRGVPIRGVEPDVLLERLAAARKGLTFAFAERVRAPIGELFEPPISALTAEPDVRVRPGDLDSDLAPLELQKRLVALRKRHREWQEEQGLNVLFLALGFLNWIDEDQQPARSPILLVPCDLTCESPREPHVLLREESDDPAVNATLRHKLSTTAGITLPDHGEHSVASYLEAVTTLIAGREGWSVEPSIVMATFPFSKLAMWEDMEQMVACGISSPLVRRLAGDTSTPTSAQPQEASAVPRDDKELRGARLDDLLDLRDQHTVVDADFSQLRAIDLARSGANLVIHGPPGTGKSQTIANIIATLIADGRRVLFVSEKTAALDVVKHRLTEAGLGAFCLDLHSERGKKASVYAQIREALEQPPATVREFPYERLIAQRASLNATVRALHEVRSPLGLSAFGAHGEIAAIGDVAHFGVAVRDLPGLDAERLRSIRGAAARVARRPREFQEHATSRWRALLPSAASPRLADLVRDDMARLRLAVDALLVAAREAAATCSVADTTTMDGAVRLADLLAHLGESPESLPRGWFDPGGIERARALTDELRGNVEKRRTLMAEIAPVMGVAVPGPHVAEWLSTAQRVRAQSERWHRVEGEHWSVTLLADPRGSAVLASQISVASQALVEASLSLQRSLGLNELGDRRSEALAAVGYVEQLRKIDLVPTSWDGTASIERVRAAVIAAKSDWSELAAAESRLAESFDLGVVERVDDDMLVRFRADYRSVFRWFRSGFRRDRRALRGCLRKPAALSLDAATTAVEQAIALRQARARWAEASARVGHSLGDRFRGRKTNWDGVLAELAEVAGVYREVPVEPTVLHSALVDTEARRSLGVAAHLVVERAATLDRLRPSVEPPSDEAMVALSEDARAFVAAATSIADIVEGLGSFVRRPVELDALIQVLQAGDRLSRLEASVAARADERSAALGDFHASWATDFSAIDSALSWTLKLLTLSPSPVPAGLIAHALRRPDRAVCIAKGRAVSDAVADLRTAADVIEQRFVPAMTPWRSWEHTDLNALRSWSVDLSEHADEASDWLEYQAAAAQLDESVGGPVTAAVRAVEKDAALVPPIVLRHVYLSWLEWLYGTVAELRFSPRDLEGVRAEFRQLDARIPAAARERVRARCMEAHPTNRPAPSGMGQLGTLQHELSKRRRQMPVRQLVARVPNLLQVLKPCFMMSPLAVSQYLPRGASDEDTLLFDTVVFDEASQVFPEDAVPTVARGKQTIVVGDRQQLPPSSFFRKAEDSDEVDDEDAEIADENRLAGVESILDVLVGLRGAGVEDVYLQVHYRSRHDALIRYSNHYFYDDRLVTFPSALGARPGLGLRSEYVADGRFDAGASRTNRVEAAKIVELLAELMDARPAEESVGVVALSRAQANLIQELVDERRLRDRRFHERFSESSGERFFVKNLENVQGDERDHILLSIGYGPTTATGSVPNRFGPVNAEGGHRRLNVAVSRARQSMTVVHSLRPEDIRSDAQGAKLLRRYLEYLRTGEKSIEGRVTADAAGEAESPFEDAVGRALEQLGYRIKRQVGCAKYFIDIAVLSESGDEFDLGIECDGATYHASPSARDRDRIRQEHLERLGWRGRMHRVWSTAWIRDTAAEIKSIERAIARSRARREIDASAPPPPVEAVREETAPPSGRTLADEGRAIGPAHALAPYVVADLRGFSNRRDVREVPAEAIAELVATIVATEVPVHEDLVIERIRSHYGLQRAGRVVREAITAGIDHAVRHRRAHWLDPHASRGGRGTFLVLSPGGQIQPRGPTEDGDVRSIEQIAGVEIDAGVIEMVGAMCGASRADAVTATARAFGFGRVGALVDAQIAEGVDRLVRRGELVERLGTLTVKR